MPFGNKCLVVSRYDDSRWELQAPLRYFGRSEMITVPAGYVTDFATVPKSLQWFAPSIGKYTLAAVVHDYLCDRMVDGRSY